jgi:hypothetical protein
LHRALILKLVAKNGKRHLWNDAHMQPGKSAEMNHERGGKSKSSK